MVQVGIHIVQGYFYEGVNKGVKSFSVSVWGNNDVKCRPAVKKNNLLW